MATEANSNVGLTITPEALFSVKIIPDNYRTKASSSYTFSLVLANPVNQTSQTKIGLPLEISVSPSPLTINSIQSLSSSASISYDSTSRVITVINCFSSKLPSGTQLQFTISSLINPQTIKQTSAFTLSTTDSLGKIID